MKVALSIFFILSGFGSNGQYKGYSYSKDSISLDIDSIVYLNLKDNANKIEWMEIVQNRPLNKIRVLNDSIALFDNLKSLYVHTRCPLKISDNISKLKLLKEVVISGEIISPMWLSFENSRESLEYLKIINYGERFGLPYKINIYTNLRTLVILEECKRIENKKVIDFFEQLSRLNLESFRFRLSGITVKQKDTVNKELKRKNIKYRLS